MKDEVNRVLAEDNIFSILRLNKNLTSEYKNLEDRIKAIFKSIMTFKHYMWSETNIDSIICKNALKILHKMNEERAVMQYLTKKIENYIKNRYARNI